MSNVFFQEKFFCLFVLGFCWVFFKMNELTDVLLKPLRQDGNNFWVCSLTHC